MSQKDPTLAVLTSINHTRLAPQHCESNRFRMRGSCQIESCDLRLEPLVLVLVLVLMRRCRGRQKKTDPAVPHPGPKQPAGTGLTPYIAPPGLTYRPDVPEASRWPPLDAVYTSALGGE